MTRIFKFPALDRFFGRGNSAVTVPPLDGGLKPNNLLDEIPQGISAEQPNDVVLWQDNVVWSEGTQIRNSAGDVLVEMESPITALATSANLLAVATLKGGLQLLDETGQDALQTPSALIEHVTALAFAPDGQLWYCKGSEQNAPDEWSRDLLEKNSSGSVGCVNVATGKVEVIRSNLGWPSGIVIRDNGMVTISETWKSQLLELVQDGSSTRVVLDEIPGYPGRLVARTGGGFWLCIFAPRNPLIEFVLREPAYRQMMMRDLDPAHWVAPRYSSGASFSEPMQGGALKQMGILKPWAPTLSYGLVAALGDDFVPQNSYHSRAGGQRHGITSALDHDSKLWLACRGNGEILMINQPDEG